MIPPIQIPTHVFEQMEDEYDWTGNELKGVTQVFRKFCGPKSIASGLEDIIKQHGEEVLSFFDIKMKRMNVKVRGKLEQQDRAVVYCKDVPGFINYIKIVRKIEKDCDIKGQSKFSYLGIRELGDL